MDDNNFPMKKESIKAPTDENSGIVYTIKSKIQDVKNNINEAKKKGILQSSKEVGTTVLSYAKQASKNAAENLKEDTGYLKEQGMSSVRNFGLTEKQSMRKYGDLQYPSLFGGSGGFSDIVFSDKGRRSKIKQVTGFSHNENDTTLLTSKKPKKINKKQKNSVDSLGGYKDPLAPASRKPKVLKMKKPKSLKVKTTKLNSMKDIGVINIFGKKKKGRLF